MYRHECMRLRMSVYVKICKYIHTYINTYTYIHNDMGTMHDHGYIHAYIHTYNRTYIHSTFTSPTSKHMLPKHPRYRVRACQLRMPGYRDSGFPAIEAV